MDDTKQLLAFVTAAVAAVDLARRSEIDSFRAALRVLHGEPAVAMFDSELRLNGISSSGRCDICHEIVDAER
jgi:hypothetical protein